MALRCVKCGSKAHKKAIYKVLTENNPLLDGDEVREELAKDFPNVECIDEDCGGKYVPSGLLEPIRRKREEFLPVLEEDMENPERVRSTIRKDPIHEESLDEVVGDG